MTSARLFKGAVTILALPAVLFPAIASGLILARLTGGPLQPADSNFTFAFTGLQLAIVAAAMLAAFILLYVAFKAVARRYRDEKSGQ